MPWQDNSGNKGGPVKGPWGQPPRGGPNGDGSGGGRGPNRPRGPGGEPPDLEELLQASRQRLKRAFPRGPRGPKGPEFNVRTAGLVGGALVFLWGLSGVYTVDAAELGVVTTFGKFQTVTGPGLHWHAPAPVQSARTETVTTLRTNSIPPTRTQRGARSEGLMLTGDKNIVDVAMKVQWKIKPGLESADEELPGVAQFIFNIDDPNNLVRTVGEASIREVVGRNTLDFVQTTGRTAVQEQTRELMQSTLDLQKSGIEITEVNLEKTEPPTSEVNEAFLDVEAAKQDREQYVNTAKAYANRIVPEARGDAQQIIERARAYQAQVTAESRGQADRFSAILAEYEKAPEVTRQRMYLETVERVLGDMNKIIVERDAGSGVVPYLPLNELTKRSAE
ncbi:MAG: FtsH protease activity modulator HflK [Parvularculaceae bacterium]